MKKTLIASTAITGLMAGSAFAGGIDRSGQPGGLIFESGNVFQFSIGTVQPSLTGTDVLGNPISNVAGDFYPFLAGVKMDVDEKLSFAVYVDQPFGADVSYGGSPATTMLGGTSAKADAYELVGVLRYKFDENWSVHGGVRAQRADGSITLSGLAYGGPPPTGLSGYNVDLDTDIAFGYLVGGAYEMPEIALRVALTYYSEVSHDFDSTEVLGPIPLGTGTTTTKTPQAVNLDFQTGIAEDTLLFGSVRWVDWSEFKLNPPAFNGLVPGGEGLIALDDTTTYEVGVARRFNDQWAGSIAVSYEAAGDELVSPLAPSTGQVGVTVGAEYTMANSDRIIFGVNYTALGDAMPETGTPDVARADFSGNDAWGIGIRYMHQF